MRAADVQAFHHSVADPEATLAQCALLMSRIEYARLDVQSYVHRLDRMGDEARVHIERAQEHAGTRAPDVAALAGYVYGVLGFTGNRVRYDDPHNSLLNQVIDRCTGIPITLAVVLLEVGARAGVRLEGVNFPNHFLLRAFTPGAPGNGVVLVDPFNNGAFLSEADCAALLPSETGDGLALTPEMFATAGKRDILVRMLLNIKRAYLRQHSFPQARDAVDLALAIDPTLMSEVRDRALLSYRLGHLAAALRDFERCLQVPPPVDDPGTLADHEQMRDQVKALRSRIAGFN